MNHYATIRAALELADSYMAGTLREEREKYAGRESISNAESIASDIEENKVALAALAELERMATVPVAYQYAHPYFGGAEIWREEQHWNGHTSDKARALYAAPPIHQVAVAPQPQFVVTDEMAERIDDMWGRLPPRPECSPDAASGRDMIAAVQAELGPQLGLAVWQEPTDDECERIYWGWHRHRTSVDTPEESMGRAMFHAVREVMGGGE